MGRAGDGQPQQRSVSRAAGLGDPLPHPARSEMRNQLILNFARADVQAYHHRPDRPPAVRKQDPFIKWDMNRNVSEPGWPDAPGDQRELWVRYVQGCTMSGDTLRARHPQVVWQSCSGGGGRADLGILRLADQIWVSDQTEAVARLAIQEGFSQIFPGQHHGGLGHRFGRGVPAARPSAFMSACAGRWVSAGTLRIGTRQRERGGRLDRAV